MTELRSLPGPKVFQTHISTIFLVDDRAYKLKKPVKTAFLDFSSIEARRQACLKEVVVNRRFAEDVYLGVADVVGPDGTICDHLVVMKRMPHDRRLSKLVLEGAISKTEISQLTEVVTKIHQESQRSDLISKDGSREASLKRWQANFQEARRFSGRYLDSDQFELAELLASRYLAGRDSLFERRIAQGRIVDGHGDLLADDIYLLNDGPRILDALEFDDQLRHVDVIDDVACLAMDLERLGAPELSWALVDAYITGSGDESPPSLVDHFIGYRALVRAKVACIRADQGDKEAAIQAHLLLRQSVEHLVAARVSLVLMGGLPGSGKSTLAQALADACGWQVLNSDVVRKELAGISHTTSAQSRYRKGIYSPDFTRKTYAELVKRARALLEHGVSVVLDASWINSLDRQAAAEVAFATSSDLVEFHVAVSDSEARARIKRRSESGFHPSDATHEIALFMAKEEHPWPSAIEIDNQDPVDRVLEKLLMATSLQDKTHAASHPITAQSA